MTRADEFPFCIVIHHRNFPEILETIDDLLREGIAATNILVVDNSEDAKITSRLRNALPAGIDLLEIANHGYGHAANAALDLISRRPLKPSTVIISTHETRIQEGSISELTKHMATDDQLAVLGPILVRREDPSNVWSTGGELTPILGRPAHVVTIPSEPVSREWVDGAFALYRYASIASMRFDESYEMYFEETDLHRRLIRDGWRIAVVPTAIVAQSTGGIPPHYLGRNVYLFSFRHSRQGQLVSYLARESLRLLVRGDPRMTRMRAQQAFWRGVIDGWRVAKRPDYPR